MSGMEVVGIVLGAIPLVVAGLKQYDEGIKTIKIARNYAREFADLKRQLVMYDTFFKDLLELVLSGCDEISLPSAAVSHESTWQNPKIEQAIRKKLDTSYVVFIDCVVSMHKTLNAFKRKLGLGDDGKLPQGDRNFFRETRKSISFALKNSAYRDLLDHIWKELSMLRQHFEVNTRLEPVRTRRKRIASEDPRPHASSLFTSLQRALRGSCQYTHVASLYMSTLDEDRSIPTSDSQSLAAFRIVLHHTSPAGQTASSWSREEAGVRTSKREPAASATAAAAIAPMGRVRFSQPAAVPQITIKVTEVHDLCVSMKKFRSHACGVCVEYLPSIPDVQHALYRPSAPIIGESPLATLSLGDILACVGNCQRLSWVHRLGIAATCSSAATRLCNTPWMAEQWGRNEITFLQKNDIVISYHPFVSADLKRNQAATGGPSNTPGYFTLCPAIKNETLFALGVLLIELCFYKPFDMLISSEDLNPDGTKHPASDLFTALRLQEKACVEASWQYGEAIRHCIERPFDRAGVYDNMVAVLEKEVEISSQP